MIRLLTAIAVGWALCVLAYVLLFEPFGSRMSGRDSELVLLWIIIPPGLFASLVLLARWVVGGKDQIPIEEIVAQGLRFGESVEQRTRLAIEMGITTPKDAEYLKRIESNIRELRVAQANLSSGPLTTFQRGQARQAHQWLVEQKLRLDRGEATAKVRAEM